MTMVRRTAPTEVRPESWIQLAGGFGKLVGDDGGDGVAGREQEAWILGSLPITIVTAMVSPKARARPRKIDPKMPSLAYGTTTCHVDSHWVAPSASAASRCSRGTASSDSRETEMMNGNRHDGRTMPAVR